MMDRKEVTLQEFAEILENRIEALQKDIVTNRIILQLLADSLGKAGGEIFHHFDQILSTAQSGDAGTQDLRDQLHQYRAFLRQESTRSPEKPQMTHLRVVEGQNEE